MKEEYHIPVLLNEAVDGLNVNSGGIYVDATFGGGGHSRKILERLGENGKLFGFDQDEAAQNNQLEDQRFTFIGHNFRHLKRFLKLHKIVQVDGILADLGVSSHQLDEAERGFSFRFREALDMRMDQKSAVDAASIINNYPPGDLQEIFSRYGEVRNAKTLANVIVDARTKYPIKDAANLLAIIEPIIKGQRNRYLAQVFQALRITVNDEMGALQSFLEQTLEMLSPGGRLVVIAYHSIEDRMVKHFLKTGNPEGNIQKDYFGNIFRPFRILTKKAVIPTEAEVKINPRSRSAKMRIGEKNITS